MVAELKHQLELSIEMYGGTHLCPVCHERQRDAVNVGSELAHESVAFTHRMQVSQKVEMQSPHIAAVAESGAPNERFIHMETLHTEAPILARQLAVEAHRRAFTRN